MNAMVGERLYGNPNSHILQTRGVSRPPGCGVSIPSLSEGSGFYTGGPGPHEGSGTLRGSGLLGRSGARLLAHELLPPPGHVVSPDLSQPWGQVRTVAGRTGLRTTGVLLLGCS